MPDDEDEPLIPRSATLALFQSLLREPETYREGSYARAHILHHAAHDDPTSEVFQVVLVGSDRRLNLFDRLMFSAERERRWWLGAQLDFEDWLQRLAPPSMPLTADEAHLRADQLNLLTTALEGMPAKAREIIANYFLKGESPTNVRLFAESMDNLQNAIRTLEANLSERMLPAHRSYESALSWVTSQPGSKASEPRSEYQAESEADELASIYFDAAARILGDASLLLTETQKQADALSALLKEGV